jgi:ribosome-binding factor A
MALSHRVERIAEQVREELSQMLATEVADPGVGLVTITRVKVTADLSLARVYWTVLDDEPRARKDTAKALARTAPFLRHLLSQRMTLRRTPEIKFQFDESVAAQDRIEKIIQELHQEGSTHEGSKDEGSKHEGSTHEGSTQEGSEASGGSADGDEPER